MSSLWKERFVLLVWLVAVLVWVAMIVAKVAADVAAMSWFVLSMVEFPFVVRGSCSVNWKSAYLCLSELILNRPVVEIL